jgi:quercetin dioxygenase-like cupin family protein
VWGRAAGITEELMIRADQGRLFDGLGAPVYRLVHPLTVGSRNLGVSLCLMAPGDEIRRHSHQMEEAYFVISGTGLMYLEGVGDLRLERGLAVYIPSNRVHGQVNDGDEMLEIVCSLSPPPVEDEPPRFAEAENE